MPFDLIQDVMLPKRLALCAGTRTFRIAVYSTNQEPYNLTMIFDVMRPRLAG